MAKENTTENTTRDNQTEATVTPETGSGTGANPENNIGHEETLSDEVKIENSVNAMKERYGNRFNVEEYKQALKEQKEKTGAIEGVDAERFVKQDEPKDNGSVDDGKNNGYSIENKDGKFYARGTNGKILQGNSFEDINDKVCEDLAKNCRSEGREAALFFHSISEEEKRTFAHNAIMKHDVTIMSGWPEDKKFWKDLKEEYLRNPDHALKDWEKMTRKIPDNVMDRTKEESERNKRLNDAELLKKMRMGKNPNLETEETSPTSTRPQRTQSEKNAVAERLRALRGNEGNC